MNLKSMLRSHTHCLSALTLTKTKDKQRVCLPLAKKSPDRQHAIYSMPKSM